MEQQSKDTEMVQQPRYGEMVQPKLSWATEQEQQPRYAELKEQQLGCGEMVQLKMNGAAEQGYSGMEQQPRYDAV